MMWTNLSGFFAIRQLGAGGARFLTTIETSEGRAAEWAAFLKRWKRKATPVRVFGPEIAGGVQ